ncbi:hypothetical protein [Microbacterium sp. CIAB417]|uniref:hypothetical protein n=1 Tax=Microbacterium sp. CIAB417 TaxID=2860287 RepID=UPI001FAD9041|nr:hypothetical protein [Microbacterium sp. CIAB417]
MVQGRLYFPFRFVDGIGGEAEAGELTGERALEFVRREVGQIAETVLASSAEEVLVDLVGVVLGLGEDEAVFASDVVAAAAVQHASGEVVVDAVTLSPLHAGVDDLLDTVEEVWGDECLVSPRVHVSTGTMIWELLSTSPYRTERHDVQVTRDRGTWATQIGHLS